RSGRQWRMLDLEARELGGETLLHHEQKRFLELWIAAKAELGDEPGDGGRADARPLGESSHALEAGDGVRGQEDPGQLALGWAEAGLVLAHELGHAGEVSCNVRYIFAHLAFFWYILDMAVKTR